jgi:hypothetical protein
MSVDLKINEVPPHIIVSAHSPSSPFSYHLFDHFVSYQIMLFPTFFSDRLFIAISLNVSISGLVI